MTRPLPETKLPEQPRARRTAERRTWSSQAWDGEKPNLFATRSEGKSFGSHIPSSDPGGMGGAAVSCPPQAVGATPARLMTASDSIHAQTLARRIDSPFVMMVDSVSVGRAVRVVKHGAR